MRAVVLLIALAACDKAPPEVPELSCRAALENSPQPAKIVAGATHQCELEKWSATLKTCIHDAPVGADLEATCFAVDRATRAQHRSR